MSEDGCRPSSILVTGGSGFMGSNFVRYVVREQPGVLVTVLDKLTYAGNPSNIAGLPADRVRLVVGDVCDEAVVDRLVSRADAVVHFAAQTHNDNAIVFPAAFLDANVRGTYTVIEACRRHGVRYHHVSTDEVFGALPFEGSDRFTEDSPYRPSSPYSSTKAASDMLVRAWVSRISSVQAGSATTCRLCVRSCVRSDGPRMTSTGSRTVRATTSATRSIRPSCAASSAGSPCTPTSTPAWRRRSSGIAPTCPGGAGRRAERLQRIHIATSLLVLYSMPKGSGSYVLERYKDSTVDRRWRAAQC